jgi:hypothetical protein
VTIRANLPVQTAHDRLLPSEKLLVRENAVECEVPAGGVRLIEFK